MHFQHQRRVSDFSDSVISHSKTELSGCSDVSGLVVSNRYLCFLIGLFQQLHLGPHEVDEGYVNMNLIHLFGISVACGVQDILILPGNGFSSCFKIQLLTWSDSEHMIVTPLSVSGAIFARRSCYRV